MKQLAKEMLTEQAKEIEQRMIECVKLDQLEQLQQYRKLFDDIMLQLKALDK